MSAPVDVWSSPTTIWAGGLRQLRAILGGVPGELSEQLAAWFERLGLPIRLAGLDVAAATQRVRRTWQASNLFPTGVPVGEIECVLSRSAGAAAG